MSNETTIRCTCYIGETESLGNPILHQCSLCEAAPELLKIAGRIITIDFTDPIPDIIPLRIALQAIIAKLEAR